LCTRSATLDPASVATMKLRITLMFAIVAASACAFAPTHAAAAAAGILAPTWSSTISVNGNAGPASTVAKGSTGGATVADLFGDGRKQIVVGSPDGSVSVLDGSTGVELAGWPQYTHGAIHTNPSVADLNNDGHQEVIATSESGRIYVWNADGSLFPGWPQHTVLPGPNVLPGFYGGVAVGDLFGDGNKELVAAAWDQHLWAWNKNGAVLSGFPIHLYDTAWDTPALVDLEHTGHLDIVVGFDSSGPPYDPHPSGGEVWAFRPTGCPAGLHRPIPSCEIPGWPKTFDQVAWASPAAVDLLNNGQTDIVEGTGFNFPSPRGHYVSAWTAAGGPIAGFPALTAGMNMASPAVGDLTGTGQREVVELSSTGQLYAWDRNGAALPGWPVVLAGTIASNPIIGPIDATHNGVWIIDGKTLKAFNSLGALVWTYAGPDAVGAAAPTIADLGNGSLSVVTVEQASVSDFQSWSVRAFPILSTHKMLEGAWPTFHGNGQSTGTLRPSATLTALGGPQNNTAMTINWTLDAGSVPASSYALWARDTVGGVWSIYTRTSTTSTQFFGVPGHSYDFAIQAGDADPGLSIAGAATTSFAAGAVSSTPFKEMYAVDGHGLLHAGSSAPIVNASSWPAWDIVRGLALAPGGLGGYLLDAYGGVHPFGNAPPVIAPAYWGGWDITRSIVLCSNGHSGYVLDGWGNLHPFAQNGTVMPPAVTLTGYWPGWDIARDVQLRDDQSGYVLDGWGGLHEFGTLGALPPKMVVSGFWPGWNIAHRFALDAAGTGGLVLDGWGGLHPFGTTPAQTPATPSVFGYWPGWDIARGVVFDPGSTAQGYTVDGWGGMHPFGSAPLGPPAAVTSLTVTPGGIVNQLAIS
jgi:hypothetical protein